MGFWCDLFCKYLLPRPGRLSPRLLGSPRASAPHSPRREGGARDRAVGTASRGCPAVPTACSALPSSLLGQGRCPYQTWEAPQTPEGSEELGVPGHRVKRAGRLSLCSGSEGAGEKRGCSWALRSLPAVPPAPAPRDKVPPRFRRRIFCTCALGRLGAAQAERPRKWSAACDAPEVTCSPEPVSAGAGSLVPGGGRGPGARRGLGFAAGYGAAGSGRGPGLGAEKPGGLPGCEPRWGAAPCSPVLPHSLRRAAFGGRKSCQPPACFSVTGMGAACEFRVRLFRNLPKYLPNTYGCKY